MLKLVTWNTDSFDSFENANKNGEVTILCDVTLSDTFDIPLALTQDLDSVVRTFIRTCNLCAQENQSLGVANYDEKVELRYLYSYDDCNWMEYIPTKQVTVTFSLSVVLAVDTNVTNQDIVNLIKKHANIDVELFDNDEARCVDVVEVSDIIDVLNIIETNI